MSRTITAEQLRQKGACPDQVCEFERRFGESVVVTEEFCESAASVFDFDWAAHHFLSFAALAKYERVCERVRARTFAQLFLTETP